ncbi:hypothetical protein Ciccas_004989 [Cichlidogyrus casuarinus]|uniref:Uncharacterized protein n=1 Tax=Cichlidogyrus casuarinus TaxID=1844966 RepID=A0ABD2QA60_9PLAT
MRIKSRRIEDSGLTNMPKPDKSGSSRYRVYLCFTEEEILIVKNTVRHPEYLIEHSYISLQEAATSGRKFTKENLQELLPQTALICPIIDYRHETDLQTRSGELGPSLPMPKIVDSFEKCSDSESSISNCLPPKKFIEDSNVSVGTLASNLSKQCNLGDQMCLPNRRMTLSSCEDKAQQNLYTNLRTMVSKSVPTAKVCKSFHQPSFLIPEPASSTINNGSEISSEFFKDVIPHITSPSLELITSSNCSPARNDDEENTATTLIPIVASADKTESSYVDVNEISRKYISRFITINILLFLWGPPDK